MSDDDIPSRSASPSPVRTRRRSRAADPLRKTTVQMHTSVLEAVRQAVAHGYAASQNEFVEEAVVAHLRELRRATVYAAYDEAARDPEFMAEMRAVTDEFDVTVGDGLESA
jgi:Arc/MetJ-type ribon-helix-helix transcriptional regulator